MSDRRDERRARPPAGPTPPAGGPFGGGRDEPAGERAGVFQQFRFLGADVRRIVNRQPARWLSLWFGEPFLAVCCYRLSRAALLALGPLWSPFWGLTRPLAFLVRPWFAVADIHPGADIGPGLLVLHPRLGVVISGRATIGANLTLTGGNVIGVRAAGPLSVGAAVTLGAKAVILGPVVVGDRVTVGAGAVVISDVPDGATVIGVPARPTSAP
jgi:serine acetyltransferase